MSNIFREISRFIVAFSYRCDKEGDYLRVCQEVDDKTLFHTKIRKAWVPIDYAEEDSEFYAYIQKYISRKPEYANESIGRAWIWNKDLNKDFHVSGQYSSDNQQLPFLINAAGLFIFRTGIGIFWYEVNHAGADIDQLILMNWGLKDISHTDTSYTLTLKTTRTIEHICSPEDIVRTGVPNAIRIVNRPNEFVPAEKIPVEGTIKKIFCKQVESSDIYCGDIETEANYSFKQYIEELLAPIEVLTYFTDKISKSSGNKIKPDKAYIFSIVIFNRDKALTNDETRRYLYWLKRGYKQSYLSPPEEFPIEIYRPFDNSSWAASIEGCANIVRLTGTQDSTDVFFRENYLYRQEIYFYLYILVLHQYYTLLGMSENIAKLPIDYNKYNKIGSTIPNALNKYNETINIFCLKIYSPQISHISHHNELYNYLIRQFDIKSSIEDIREALQIVDQMVKSSRQRERSNFLRVFVIFGGIFAILQTISNILAMYEMGLFGVDKSMSMERFTGIVLLYSIAGGLILWIISRILMRD